MLYHYEMMHGLMRQLDRRHFRQMSVRQRLLTIGQFCATHCAQAFPAIPCNLRRMNDLPQQAQPFRVGALDVAFTEMSRGFVLSA